MRQTSRIAYTEIVEDGTLGTRQRLAWETLRAHGPMTGQELARVSGSPGIWKRLSELERTGYVREIGTRKCTVTGRTSTVWAAEGHFEAQLDMFGGIA